MPCGDLNVREIQKREDILTADSLCSTAENNVTLESNYTPIKCEKKSKAVTMIIRSSTGFRHY